MQFIACLSGRTAVKTRIKKMKLQVEPKNKQITPVGVVFLLIWSFLCLVTIWVLNTFPIEKPVVIQLSNLFSCGNIENDWKQKEIFKTDESIYICGYVKSTVADLDGQIQIRVYKDKITSQIDVIFYDNQQIENGEMLIPINTYLIPGKYMVQISSGKRTLGTITFEVVE